MVAPGELLDEQLDGRVAQVLAQPLYWFPIRHHSPASAHYLRAAIRDRKPELILIEGPSQANDLIPHLLESDTRPPVAIYASYSSDAASTADDPGSDAQPERYCSWYPLLDYSPEYVALQEARALRAEVAFIDAPHYARQRSDARRDDAQHDNTDAESAVRDSFERQFSASDLFRALTDAGGYRNWQQAWDSLFEHRRFTNYQEFRYQLASLCAAVRAGTRTATDTDTDTDTRQRERYMRREIDTRLDGREPQQAMVVCGGLHLFMDHDDRQPPAEEAPAGRYYHTLVPYSFPRLSKQSGYAAGNRAPRYYQQQWLQHFSGDASAELAARRHLLHTIAAARAKGEPLSPADAIAAARHAEQLAALRERASPLLDELEDALFCCCCKGDPNEFGQTLRAALYDANIGSSVGRVSAVVGRLPLVADFYQQLQRLDLAEFVATEQRRTLDLDTRDSLARRRSVLLHRLQLLGVPFAALETRANNGLSDKLFLERWRLRWTPALEQQLTELNLYGETIAAATLARLQEQLAASRDSAADSAKTLLEAANTELAARRAEQVCASAVASDGRFISLSQAFHYLTLLEQVTRLRGRPAKRLNTLLQDCFQRACFALPHSASLPEQEQQSVVDGLLTLAEAFVGQRSRDYDRELFASRLRLSAETSSAPFLRGALRGLLLELRQIDAALLSADIKAFAHSTAVVKLTAGEFIDGVFAVSKTALHAGGDKLVAAIDELLNGCDWDSFLTLLPRLRMAFERLSRAQRDGLGDLVAQRYGLRDVEQLEVRISDAAATSIARIDRQVAQIMADWTD